jgi:drug/metabolite transporter (DMT)-like permease
MAKVYLLHHEQSKVAKTMKLPTKQPFLPFALLIAILAVSTASIFIRYAQNDAPSLAIAALRLTFASVMLAPVALTRYRSQLLALTRSEIILGLLSGLFLSLHFATWISSLEFTTIASSVVFVSTGPLWVALLSPVFLNERLSPGAFMGLALALLGGVIIGFSGACGWDHGLTCPNLNQVLHGHAIWGDALALTGALAVTGYLIIGRHLRQKMPLIPYIFLVYSFAAIGLLIAMFAAGESPVGYPRVTYLWLFLLALIPQIIGHSTYNWALRFLPAAFVAVTTLGEPIGSATLAYFLLGEQPSMAILLGGSLILIGIFFAARNRANPARSILKSNSSDAKNDL